MVFQLNNDLLKCFNLVQNKYSTSLDPRGYIPVYEYTINEFPILIDIETKYIYWTGIWKALGRNKLEIAKIIDNNLELSKNVKKIRGGYLKIQGSWLPYNQSKQLAIRTCWPIKDQLIPLFGIDFPPLVFPLTHSNYIKPPKLSKENKKMKQNLLSSSIPSINNLILNNNHHHHYFDNNNLLNKNNDLFTIHCDEPCYSDTISSSSSSPDSIKNSPLDSDQIIIKELIDASLTLQKLSQDDGTPHKEVIPPSQFLLNGTYVHIDQNNYFFKN